MSPDMGSSDLNEQHRPPSPILQTRGSLKSIHQVQGSAFTTSIYGLPPQINACNHSDAAAT
ncbi:hypothetical protein DL93DRAFT_2091657 [Clavulina sp. PMI_390]|nr:hypothetical protein DL93DRAFT_2091657 [Clavulina sp. PMI_390]